MTITIENNSKEEINFNCEEVIKNVIEAATDYVGCNYEAEIYVELTDNARIHEINKQFRNIDMPTDVLSFPMIEYDVPGDFTAFDECDDYFNPETGELILGDIIISVERAIQQAHEYNHSLKREIAFLVAHSMLHLFGFDHIVESEMKQMENMQEEILQNLNIQR